MAEQLEFDLGDTPAHFIPTRCGRGLGECRVIRERSQYRCLICRAVAPLPHESTQPTIFDRYIESQIRQLKFLRKAGIAAGERDPGNS
jgi:hypothetical protein